MPAESTCNLHERSCGAAKLGSGIIATGARPRVLPGLEPDKKLVWTYFEAMVPERMPKSLLVVGSGAIGIEFASFFHTMGADVTVVEVLPQIFPVEDAEIAGLARKRFEKQGIKILTNTKVTKLEKKARTAWSPPRMTARKARASSPSSSE